MRIEPTVGAVSSLLRENNHIEIRDDDGLADDTFIIGEHPDLVVTRSAEM